MNNSIPFEKCLPKIYYMNVTVLHDMYSVVCETSFLGKYKEKRDMHQLWKEQMGQSIQE